MQLKDVLIKCPDKKYKFEFKININHPSIKPLYIAYKKKVMAPINWSYAPTDYERVQFDCIILNMFRICGADEEKRKEYFENVIKNLKKLDYERMNANKKADYITRAKLSVISNLNL